eukprot:Amastigsp_a8049_27.p3 type:complete len:313 gc:universal Amastigsp_a8049_27:723-1661(+)
MNLAIASELRPRNRCPSSDSIMPHTPDETATSENCTAETESAAPRVSISVRWSASAVIAKFSLPRPMSARMPSYTCSSERKSCGHVFIHFFAKLSTRSCTCEPKGASSNRRASSARSESGVTKSRNESRNTSRNREFAGASPTNFPIRKSRVPVSTSPAVFCVPTTRGGIPSSSSVATMMASRSSDTLSGSRTTDARDLRRSSPCDSSPSASACKALALLSITSAAPADTAAPAASAAFAGPDTVGSTTISGAGSVAAEPSARASGAPLVATGPEVSRMSVSSRRISARWGSCGCWSSGTAQHVASVVALTK